MPEISLETIEKETNENPFVEKFEAFFGNVYKKEIQRLVEKYPEKRSLNIDFKELEKFDFQLADDLIENPDYLLEAASEAIQHIDVPALGIDEFKPHIRFYNLPKDRQPLLRNISSSHLNKLISVEGVLRQITDVLPKLHIATWQCRRCGNTYRVPQGNQEQKMPAFCECRHRDFVLVPTQSDFVDYQKIQIQEPLEKLHGNEQPAYIDIYVSDDMVNKISAGDKTRFVGVLRLYPADPKKTFFSRYLEAIHLEETEREFEDVEITPEEEEEIKKLAMDPKVYEKLIQSLAPAIYGHETVKESIVLQLFGGVKKVLPGDTTLRGNIHVLLVGDPGAAKSMMLLATNRIAPKSIYFAGKSASAAGISATAVKDEFGEGGWTLKAGALVLASGGICCVDELDKMEAEDRSALHESLEQQTISVAKAGIVTRFKTETSVLAASNPKFSRFDPYRSFIEQIDLPSSLISRFDLFFMIKDVLDRKKDEEIAAHILKTHQAGEILSQYKRKGKALKKKELEQIEETTRPIIDAGLFRKYISYARQNIFPAMSKESIQKISDFYVNLRELGKESGSYAATHRQLEGLIRLAEASARVRLSDVVESADAERAIRLLRASLEGVVTDPETGKIDIDIITTGQTHAKIEQIRAILGIIKEKAIEMDMVPVEDVLNDAEAAGIEKERARALINELDKRGEIYRPRHNFVKPTNKG